MSDSRLIPFYFLCDESQRIAVPDLKSIQDTIQSLHSKIIKDSVLENRTRLSIASFASDCEILVPCARPSEIRELLSFVPGGSCNFGNALRKVKMTIETDINNLKMEGIQNGIGVLRPTLVILLGDEPTDEWIADFADITNSSTFKFAPNTSVQVLAAVSQKTFEQIALIGADNHFECERIIDLFSLDKYAMNILNFFKRSIEVAIEPENTPLIPSIEQLDRNISVIESLSPETST